MYSINRIFLNISVVALLLFMGIGAANSNNSEKHEVLEFELKNDIIKIIRFFPNEHFLD